MVVVPINEEIEIFQKSLVTFENEQKFRYPKKLNSFRYQKRVRLAANYNKNEQDFSLR